MTTLSRYQKKPLVAPAPAAPAAAPEVRAPASRVRPLLQVACILFVATIPLEMLALVGETFALPRLTGILLFLAALTQPRLALRRPAAPFWWFALYVMIAVFAGVPYLDLYSSSIALRLSTLVQLLVMFWIMGNILADEVLSRRALLAFTAMCMLIALFMAAGLFQTAIQTVRGIRYSFAGGNANQVGGTMTIGLLAMIGMAYTARLTGKVWRWLVPVIAVPLAFSIMDTGSRGAVAALVGGLIVLAVSGEHAARRLRNLFIFVAASVVVYVAVYTTFISRVRWEEAIITGRVSGRERIYPALLRMFAEKPIQGWGVERNRRELATRVPQIQASALDAHNLYLHVLTEVGLVGSIPFFIGIILCLRLAYRARKTVHGYLPLVLTAAMLVANMANTWILRKPLWFVLAYGVAAGLAATVRRRVRAPASHVRFLQRTSRAREATPVAGS